MSRPWAVFFLVGNPRNCLTNRWGHFCPWPLLRHYAHFSCGSRMAPCGISGRVVLKIQHTLTCSIVTIFVFAQILICWIIMKFCSCHDSSAVMACAKFQCDCVLRILNTEMCFCLFVVYLVNHSTVHSLWLWLSFAGLVWDNTGNRHIHATLKF